MADTWASIKEQLDSTTIVSLVAVLMILNASYLLSKRVLSPTTPGPYRVLFIWHAFDFLIHSIFEGSFLYNCFVGPLSSPGPIEPVANTHPASSHAPPTILPRTTPRCLPISSRTHPTYTARGTPITGRPSCGWCMRKLIGGGRRRT